MIDWLHNRCGGFVPVFTNGNCGLSHMHCDCRSEWLGTVYVVMFLWLLAAFLTPFLVCCCWFTIQQVVQGSAFHVKGAVWPVDSVWAIERGGVAGLEKTGICLCFTACCMVQFTVWLYVTSWLTCMCNWMWYLCSLKKKTLEGCIPLEKVKVQRSVIPSKDNPPPEMNDWLYQFKVCYELS